MLLSYHRHNDELLSVFDASAAERSHPIRRYAIEIAPDSTRRLARRSTPPACRRAASSSRARRSGVCTAIACSTSTADEPILIPDGERYKQLATVGQIYDALIRAGADRLSTIIAVGGGVTGDIAGFAAATLLRGIPVVQVPTTLLAQVDSSVGGKVGVNHAAGQESHWRVPSTSRRRDRSGAAGHASAAGVQGRPLRSREVRRHCQPAAVRADLRAI